MVFLLIMSDRACRKISLTFKQLRSCFCKTLQGPFFWLLVSFGMKTRYVLKERMGR